MFTRTLIAAMLATALFATGCEKLKEERETEAEEKAEAKGPVVDLAAEEEAIRNRSAEWMNYANAKDVDTIVNGVLAPDAVTVMGGEVRKGSAAIQAGMEKDAKRMPDSVISWKTTAVKVAGSGDMAVEKGEYYLDPDGASGRKSATSGTFVTVWEKIDGNWRVTTDVATENEPAT